jgi:SHS2 domain-containing protein
MDGATTAPAARWEHFESSAGTGVLGFGDTQAVAMEQAAAGLVAAVMAPGAVLPWESIEIRCEARPGESPVEAWLEAVLREMRARRMLFSRFQVRIDGNRLRASASGEAIDLSRHRLAPDFERITVHAPPDPGLQALARHGEGWLAQALLRRPPAA